MFLRVTKCLCLFYWPLTWWLSQLIDAYVLQQATALVAVVTRGTVFCSKAASRVITVDCLKDDAVRVPASGCHAPCWQGPGGGGSADTGGVVARHFWGQHLPHLSPGPLSVFSDVSWRVSSVFHDVT